MSVVIWLTDGIDTKHSLLLGDEDPRQKVTEVT